MPRAKGGKTRMDTLEARFWKKVVRGNDDECWMWVGCKSRGYGQIQVVDRMITAHRVALMLAGIEIPCGMAIDHKCNNALCVNPGHLRIVTPDQNQMNKRINSRNTSGLKGVSPNPRCKTFRAVIASRGKDVYLGCFDTPEEAHTAYCEAAIRLHGEFANFGHSSIDSVQREG